MENKILVKKWVNIVQKLDDPWSKTMLNRSISVFYSYVTHVINAQYIQMLYSESTVFLLSHTAKILTQ